MITYPIGNLARHLITVTIDREGQMSAESRSRTVDGELETVTDKHWSGRRDDGPCSFVVRVRRGDSGTIEILPAPPSTGGSRTVIPLGVEQSFFAGDLPVSAGANGAYTQSESVRFEVTSESVAWRSENLSGRMAFSAHLPVVCVALRLSGDNHGEIQFLSTRTVASNARRSGSSQEGVTISSLDPRT